MKDQGNLADEVIAVTLNGEPRVITFKSLSALLAGMSFNATAVAVAVNRVCVRRRDFDSTLLYAGDEIEVLSPMAGG